MTRQDSNSSMRGWARALTCTALTTLAGCSLIVNLAEKEEDGGLATNDASADAVDAMSTVDATPTAFCGPSLTDTLAYFSFENDQDAIDLSNSVAGGAGAKSQTVANNQFGDLALSIADGPSGCGKAARMAEGENRVLSLNHVDLNDVQSVDMWVRIDSQMAFEAQTTIISKDQVGVHNGDFSVSVFHDMQGNTTHFIMRIQRQFQGSTSAEASFFLCSANVSLNEWHHVAASATGEPAQLYVDGVLANGSPTIDPVFGEGNACNSDPTGVEANRTTTSENPHNWLVSASTGLSPGTVAFGFFSGSIDELRFRSVGFSQDDATTVYGVGRGLATAASATPAAE
jgi:hypothetical protein